MTVQAWVQYGQDGRRQQGPDSEMQVVRNSLRKLLDHVGRTRLANSCGSRDDSLSWNLSRVKQGGAQDEVHVLQMEFETARSME